MGVDEWQEWRGMELAAHLGVLTRRGNKQTESNPAVVVVVAAVAGNAGE